jgi:hypothetical protein
MKKLISSQVLFLIAGGFLTLYACGPSEEEIAKIKEAKKRDSIAAEREKAKKDSIEFIIYKRQQDSITHIEAMIEMRKHDSLFAIEKKAAGKRWGTYEWLQESIRKEKEERLKKEREDSIKKAESKRDKK